jgi:hypothetical protein
MPHFPGTNVPLTRHLLRQFYNECSQFGAKMRQVPCPIASPDDPGGLCTPLAAFRSQTHAAILWRQPEGTLRLSVNRCRINEHKGTWADGIKWDELQRIKAECGFADKWMVEVYPPADDLVDVANMRHLFLLDDPPPYAWHKTKTD